MKLKCLIIDDEPPARRILANHIKRTPFLTLMHECSSAVDALGFLNKNKMDLIFLDIMMPHISGFEFLKSLSKSPPIIITSAYSKFALESYEYSVVDFLMKPIPFDRFLKAVNKILDKHSIQPNIEPTEEFIFLKADKIIHKIFVKDIKYIVAHGNYLKVISHDKNLLICETMQKIMLSLTARLFIRIHKSYIVSSLHIDSIVGNTIKIGNKNLPIGRSYRHQVIEKLENQSNRK